MMQSAICGVIFWMHIGIACLRIFSSCAGDSGIFTLVVLIWMRMSSNT